MREDRLFWQRPSTDLSPRFNGPSTSRHGGTDELKLADLRPVRGQKRIKRAFWFSSRLKRVKSLPLDVLEDKYIYLQQWHKKKKKSFPKVGGRERLSHAL